MRLRRNQDIAGRPAMQVRSLLRRLNQEFWTVDTAARVLRIPGESARRHVYALRRVGYVEVVPGQPPGTWRNTMAGNALANATAAPPTSRADADRVLNAFLIRVGIVNDAKTSLYSVGKVVVFGSYLGNQDRVGDIDLAIRLDRRPEVALRWPEASLARAEEAENQGRLFRGFLERLAWPETEVNRYLRGGARSLSLHDWAKEEPWLQHVPHKVLLEDESTPPLAKSAPQRCTEPQPGFHQSRSNTRRASKRPPGCPFSSRRPSTQAPDCPRLKPAPFPVGTSGDRC